MDDVTSLDSSKDSQTAQCTVPKGFTAYNTVCVHNFRELFSTPALELHCSTWHCWVSQSKNPVCDAVQHR